MEKRIHTSLLLSFYAPLLTERQLEILRFYYEDDLSLTEIAELLGMTRQAAHDAIRRGDNQLALLEDKLKLHAHWAGVCERLLACHAHLQNGNADQADLAILALLEEEQARGDGCDGTDAKGRCPLEPRQRD